ncbi:carbon-nitrogen hydrolase [Fennellomyces sp. T-0311]|nr:carbon-nitrogen hydrolase [Fennellomyces sp. T-0311]
MKIAAVQLHIDHKDRAANWDRAEAFMAQAAEQQVDLIVFPEFFIGGPGRKSAVVGGSERFSKLAQRYGMDIVTGTLIERDPDDGKYYNVAYYIDKSGEILLDYRKVHLWAPERKYLTPGNEYKVVKNRFGVVIGLCACWDIIFNEIFRHMCLEQGAQLIIAPAYWTLDDVSDTEMMAKYDRDSEIRLINSLCVARAFENECCVVFCNSAYQSDKDRPQPFGVSAGCSQITVPFRGQVAHCQHDREEMIVADIDVATLTKDAETAYQIRQDWNEGRVFNGPPSKSKL